MAQNALMKVPDGAGGFTELHPETNAEAVKYSTSNVKSFLDNLPSASMSAFMKTLLTASDAAAARNILGVAKSPFTDETGRKWFGKNASISTSQSKFGASSLYLTGGGFGLKSWENIQLGGNDFAISFWTYVTSLSAHIWPCTLYSNTGTTGLGFGFMVHSGGYPRILWMYNGSGAIDTTSTTQPTYNLNTWQHWEVDYRKSDNMVFFFFNGNLLVSKAVAALANSQSIALNYIGSNPKTTTNQFTCYIDEFFITNKLLHTAAFTPPTSPYTADSDTVALLHFEGN